MAGISTHILNASLGQPASKVLVKLLQQGDQGYVLLDQQITDADGRIKTFNIDAFVQSNYQLIFEI
ncbi:MAG: hydroxyisourate hydrolase, partial [Acinetobacter sp.]|nr:hydroxyisourate hydrolase [Acinetobacter sp.]